MQRIMSNSTSIRVDAMDSVSTSSKRMADLCKIIRIFQRGRPILEIVQWQVSASTYSS